MSNAASALDSRQGGSQGIARPPFNAGALRLITSGHVERYQQVFDGQYADSIKRKDDHRCVMVAKQDLSRAELSSLGRRTPLGIQEEAQRKVVQGLLLGDLHTILQAVAYLKDATRFCSQTYVSYMAGLV